MNDPIWSHTNACDVSIDIVNSVEALAGIHLGESTYTLRRPNQRFEDIKLYVDAPSDTIQDDGLYQLMDNYDKWDDLFNTTDVDNDAGISHTFTSVNMSGTIDGSINLFFRLANVNHKYGTFEAN